MQENEAPPIERTKSAFMTRQSEKTASASFDLNEMNALSPIQEMELANGELEAKRGVIHRSMLEADGSASQRVLTAVRFASRIRAKVRPQESIDEEEKEEEMDKITSESLMEREEANKKLPRYVVHPHGHFRLRWDIVCISLILYNALLIPFQIAFYKGESTEYQHLEEIFIDAFFWLDLILNFTCAFDVEGKIESRLEEIAKHYLKSWFFVDLLSVFPFFLFFSEEFANTLRLIRLIRLFRMFRIMRILNRLEYVLLIRSSMSSIFKFILLVSFTSHWFSCIFFFISESETEGWVDVKLLRDDSMLAQYVAAFYWSIMTMTTVGFGDIAAITTNERLFATFAMVNGAAIFTYGITNVVSMVATLTSGETAFRVKLDKLNEYMAARQLRSELQDDIREFYHNSRQSRETNLKMEGVIMRDLSALLRSKIATEVNDSFLQQMPFFLGANHHFIMELALVMCMVCFSPLEDVIMQGEIGDEMFFIFRGTVEVIIADEQVQILGENQYFGEMAILTENNKRHSTIRTICFCELRMLTREMFLLALEHYPDMEGHIKNYLDIRRQESESHSDDEEEEEDEEDDDSDEANFQKNERKKNLRMAPFMTNINSARHKERRKGSSTLKRFEMLDEDMKSEKPSNETEILGRTLSNILEQQESLLQETGRLDDVVAPTNLIKRRESGKRSSM